MRGYVTVLGTFAANGRSDNIGTHAFDFQDAGVVHSINGEKRAEVAAEHWPAYCETVPEAAEAQRRLEAAQAPATEPQA